MKFVNHAIAFRDSERVFLIDHKDCSEKVAKNGPLVYEDCRAYNFNPAMRNQCRNENKYRLQSFKNLRKKNYTRCLKKKGWKQEPVTKIVNDSNKAYESKSYTLTEEREKIPLCIGCLPK